MRRASLLEQKAADVDKVITVLRSAVASGIGWDELTDYVAAQQELGNPIALMVHALRLEVSTRHRTDRCKTSARRGDGGPGALG